MRLLFVGTDPSAGGTETHFITLAKAMLEAGHSVAAVVLPGSCIHQGLQDSEVSLYWGFFRNAIDPRGIKPVWRAVRQFRPDWIIASHSKIYWPLLALSRLLGVRLALFKHMDSRMRPATHYFIPRLAGRFIVISDFMRQSFIAQGVPPARLYLLHNPVDLNYFHPDPALRKEARDSLNLADDDIVLGFIGRFEYGKGIYTLLDAANQAMRTHSKLKVLWVGDGSRRAELMAKIAASGFVSRHICRDWTSDLARYYASLDLLAMPSVAAESFGRVSIEAQAFGIPVLGSNLGGIPETMIPGITGQLIEPRNVQAWCNAILRLASRTDIRQSLGQAGRKYISEHFSTSVIAAKFGEMLSSDYVEVPEAPLPNKGIIDSRINE